MNINKTDNTLDVAVKVFYLDAARRFRLCGTLDDIVQDLQAKARELFDISSAAGICFFYVDDEGDAICMSSAVELAEALQYMPSLAVFRMETTAGSQRAREAVSVKEAPQTLVDEWVAKGIKNPANVHRIYSKFDGDADKLAKHFSAVLEERRAKEIVKTSEKSVADLPTASQDYVDEWAAKGIKNPVAVQRVYAKFNGDEEKISKHFNAVLEKRQQNKSAEKCGGAMEAPQQLVDAWAAKGIKNPANVQRVYAKFCGDEEKVAAHFNLVLKERKAKQTENAKTKAIVAHTAPQEYVDAWAAKGIKNPVNVQRIYSKFDGDEEKVAAHFNAILQARQDKQKEKAASVSVASDTKTASEEAVQIWGERGIKNPVNVHRVYAKFNGDLVKIAAHFNAILDQRKAKQAEKAKEAHEKAVKEPVTENQAPPTASQAIVEAWAARGIKNPANVQRVYAKYNGDEEKVATHFNAILEERKAKQAEKQAERQAEKEARQAARQAEKEARQELKRAEKEARRAAKEEEKAVKASEKNAVVSKEAPHCSAPQELVKIWGERGIKNPVNVHRVYARFNGDEEKIAAHFNAILNQRKAKQAEMRAARTQKSKSSETKKSSCEDQFTQVQDAASTLDLKHPGLVRKVYAHCNNDSDKTIALLHRFAALRDRRQALREEGAKLHEDWVQLQKEAGMGSQGQGALGQWANILQHVLVGLVESK